MKTTYKLENRHKVLGLIIALSALYDWRISTGIVIGYFFAFIHSKFLAYRFNKMFDARKTSIFLITMGSLLGMMILVIPIALSFVLPSAFHFIGVFIGLTFNKYYLYIGSFKKKG